MACFVPVMYLCPLSTFENHARTIEQVSSTGTNGAVDLLPTYLHYPITALSQRQHDNSALGKSMVLPRAVSHASETADSRIRSLSGELNVGLIEGTK